MPHCWLRNAAILAVTHDGLVNDPNDQVDAQVIRLPLDRQILVGHSIVVDLAHHPHPYLVVVGLGLGVYALDGLNWQRSKQALRCLKPWRSMAK